MLLRLTPTDVGTLCAFLTGREKCRLGLAEDLGKCGFFFGSSARILWVNNGAKVRVDDSICGQTMLADWARRYVQDAASGRPKEVTQS
jgi:hypothetical protein